jgi:hypothetical protein
MKSRLVIVNVRLAGIDGMLARRVAFGAMMRIWRPHVRFLLACTLLIGSVLACSGPNGDDPTATRAGDGSSGSTATAESVVSATTEPAAPTPPATAEGSAPETTPAPTSTDPAATTEPPPVADTPTIPVAPTMSVIPDPTQVYSTPAVPDPTPTQIGNPEPADGVLPGNRVVSYYGHPNSPQMGILGEFATKEEARDHLLELAASYAAADPSRPVIPALELITTVAQPHPGDDGDYLGYSGDEMIQEFVDFTAANNMLLILDLQIGHDTIPNQINLVRKFLEYPHVHVALDPEFSTKASIAVPTDRAPGEFIGEVNGHDVNLAIQMLSDLVAEQQLPRKMLIVHQFEAEMIYNKYVITPQPGVDFVLDMDGFGEQDAKIDNYGNFVRDELIEYGGIKLFYRQDEPLMTPEQVVTLDPAPLVVIFQ